MAITPSNMTAIGFKLPLFSLPDTRLSNQTMHTNTTNLVKNQPILILFICNHCPFVLHLIKPLVDMITRFQSQGLQCVAISSNDPITHPSDAPEKMTDFATQHHFDFPYCFDATQEVAKTFGAACTPDFFLFDQNHLLGLPRSI